MPPSPITRSTPVGPNLRATINELIGDVGDLDDAVEALDAANHVKSYGKSVVTPQEVVASGDYALMPTPDKVTVVLPEDGLLAIAFHGMWAFSPSAAAGRAAIFIGSNQLRYIAAGNGFGGIGTAGQYADLGSTPAGVYRPLTTWAHGLVTNNASNSDAYGGGVTTGQIIGLSVGSAQVGAVPSSPTGASAGGICYAFAAAGTYDVSVRYWGNIAAQKRRLWVWTMK